MYKKFLLAILLCFLFVPTSFARFDSKFYKGYNRTKRIVSVRSEPKFGNNIVGYYAGGELVYVSKVQGQWCVLDQYGEGVLEYIPCFVLEPTPMNIVPYLQQSRNKEGNQVLGSPTAKVVMEDFSDYQCPYCSWYFNHFFSKILLDYVVPGKVSYVYYDVPLDYHDKAQLAAEAAQCAGDQKAFWEMHSWLLIDQTTWEESKDFMGYLEDLAPTVGVDFSKLKKCMDSHKYADQITKDTTTWNKRGADGLSTFYANNVEIRSIQSYFVDGIESVAPGSYQDFTVFLDALSE